MASRGRPRHPDILTPREWEVLELLRSGASNAQIAERLGIAERTAKFHVSEILSKLGVSTREEAASLSLAERRRWWAAWPLWARITAGATVAAAIAGLAVLAWDVLRTGGPESEEAPLSLLAQTDQRLYLLGQGQIAIVDPSEQRIVQTLPAEYDPQIAISPDGSMLYVTDNRSMGSALSIFDARDWRLLNQIPSQDRIGDIGIGRFAMTVSADGRYLYIHKSKILNGTYHGPNGYSAPLTDHWWDIFDTASKEFSANPPHVPNCGEAQLFLPLRASSPVAVLCHELSALMFVDVVSGRTISSIGTYASAQAAVGVCNAGEEIASAVEQADRRTIYLVTKEGCVLAIDVDEMAVARSFRIDLPAGWRVPYDLAALSPTGDSLFIGVGPGESLDEYGSEVWVFNVFDEAQTATIGLGQSATGIGISLDGRLLYAVSPARKSLLILEVSTGRQVSVINDLPGAPELIEVARTP
jgi:DNA-binding CsgD family transcriptional regulator